MEALRPQYFLGIRGEEPVPGKPPNVSRKNRNSRRNPQPKPFKGSFPKKFSKPPARFRAHNHRPKRVFNSGPQDPEFLKRPKGAASREKTPFEKKPPAKKSPPAGEKLFLKKTPGGAMIYPPKAAGGVVTQRGSFWEIFVGTKNQKKVRLVRADTSF